MIAWKNALAWSARPFPSLLVDPDGVVSDVRHSRWNAPDWLKYPVKVLAVDDERLGAAPADALDAHVQRAFAAGRGSVRLVVASQGAERTVDVPLRRFDASAWWLYGGGLFVIGALYGGAGLVALASSPHGLLARAFAKAALTSGAFLVLLFDYHTTRALVPVFTLAFTLVPVCLVGLALRLPDDVGWLARFPWAPRALEAAGAALGATILAAAATGLDTTPLHVAASLFMGAGACGFAGIFVVRFARAKGPRRTVMRALLLPQIPAHLFLGARQVLSLVAPIPVFGGALADVTLLVLALTPVSSVIAFLRHDLWRSKAEVSRMLVRVVLGAVSCGVAVTAGAALATALGVPVHDALLATSVGGAASLAVVSLALRGADRAFFAARDQYKPSVEKLAVELTTLRSPPDVAAAIEGAVRRWLACDDVVLELVEAHLDVPATPSRHDQDERDAAEPPLETSVLRLRAVAPASGAGTVTVTDRATLDLAFRGRLLGTLRVGTKRGGAPYTSEDLDLLRTIANQAALALANARSYAALEQLRRDQVAALKDERAMLLETLSAEIAHEIRYPINYFRSVFAEGRGERALDHEELEIGCEEIDRLERLVSGLRRMSHPKLARRPVSAFDLAQRSLRLMRDDLAEREVVCDVDPGVKLDCDADQVTQVLVNLLSNAHDAAGPGVALGVELVRRAKALELVVWDRGPGLSASPAKLFAPWFTTKKHGTGLGLAIAHRIVRQHGWSIDPERVGDQTRFVIRIPLVDAAPSSNPSSRAGAA